MYSLVDGLGGLLNISASQLGSKSSINVTFSHVLAQTMDSFKMCLHIYVVMKYTMPAWLNISSKAALY